MPNGNTGTARQQFDLQLDQQMHNFKIMLPQHVPLERFRRVVVTAVLQDQKLFHADRRSLFLAAQKCASDGLLPDGREAVLLPFNTKVNRKLPDATQQDVWVDLITYVPMIQGIRARMRNTGLVASAEAYVVYRNDKFFQKFGSIPQIVHEPPTLGADRGDAVGAYAIIRLTSGEVIQEVMDKAEIERIRSFSKAKDGPAWKNHWGEMARKAVLKRAAKSAPTSAEMLQLFERDEESPEIPSLVELPAPEPEPPRHTGGQPPTEAATYLVVDAEGEEHEYESAEGAARALVVIFDDARRRGPAMVEAMRENNAQAIDTLKENAPELAEEFDRDAFGLRPLPDRPSEDSANEQRTTQPPRDGERPAGEGLATTASPAGETSAPGDLLDRAERDTLYVPLRPEGLDHWHRQMMAMIAEAPMDKARLARIRLQNENGIKKLKATMPDQYSELMRALAAKG